MVDPGRTYIKTTKKISKNERENPASKVDSCHCSTSPENPTFGRVLRKFKRKGQNLAFLAGTPAIVDIVKRIRFHNCKEWTPTIL